MLKSLKLRVIDISAYSNGVDILYILNSQLDLSISHLPMIGMAQVGSHNKCS